MLRPLLRCSRLTLPLYKEAPSVQYQLPRLVHIEPAKRARGADYKYKSEEEREAIAEAERKAKKRRLMAMGLAGGVAAGFIYANLEFWIPALSKKPEEKGTASDDREFMLEKPPPEFPPARSIVNPDDKTGLKITLFQYQTCPFCCKARVFLDYFGFSYDVIEVNSVLRQQVKWSKYKKVPILVASYGDKVVQVNDSSVIVSALYSLLADSQQTSLDQVMNYYPTLRYNGPDGKEVAEIQNKYFLMFNETKVMRTKEDIVEERKWRKWVDDTLVHMLSPNVYRTPTEALDAFKWFNQVGNWERHFSWWERNLVIYFGALVMYILGNFVLKKRHNLKDDVRESLYDECNRWTKAVDKKGGEFMGGSKPNLSDLAVFGVLNAIEGCEAFQDARVRTKIGVWFDRMKAVVSTSGGKDLVAAFNN